MQLRPILLFGCLAAAYAQPAPGVNRILAAHLRACGGKQAWAKVKTIARTGTALPGFGDLALETGARAPSAWYFNLKLKNGAVQTHASDGAKAWETAPTSRVIDPAQAIDEAMLNDAFLPLNLRLYFPEMTLKGRERNGEAEVWVVEAKAPQGRAKTLYFDTRSGFLTRAGKVTYADYRDAGGVKLPFLIRYGWQAFQYASAAVNGQVDVARFVVPTLPKPSVAENLPSGGAVVDRYLEAIGGEAAFRKFRSQTRRGVIREGGQTFEMETSSLSPGKWMMKFSSGGKVLDTQVSDGASAWSVRGSDVKDLGAKDRAESESVAAFDLPLAILAARPSVTVKNREKHAGREVYLAEADLPGRRATLRFDVETGLVDSIDATGFIEYREIDGVKVPSKMTVAGGQLTVEFTEIRHNVPVEEALFRRPAAGPEYEKAFAGLEGAEAVAMLRRAFGQGVTPSDGRLLYDLIVERGYKRALDIGTAGGYAALWFALAMKKTGGSVVTIEIDPEVADEARLNFRQAGLDRIVDSRINDALLEIPAMKGGFDFVFMDPGAPLNKKLFDLLNGRLAGGGTIAAHNASGFKTSQPDFLNAITGAPDLETKIVETASGGISITRRK